MADSAHQATVPASGLQSIRRCACGRRMSSLAFDLHIECEKCRGMVCDDRARCAVCTNWDDEFFHAYVMHCRGLVQKREYKKKVKALVESRRQSCTAYASNPRDESEVGLGENVGDVIHVSASSSSSDNSSSIPMTFVPSLTPSPSGPSAVPSESSSFIIKGDNVKVVNPSPIIVTVPSVSQSEVFNYSVKSVSDSVVSDGIAQYDANLVSNDAQDSLRLGEEESSATLGLSRRAESPCMLTGLSSPPRHGAVRRLDLLISPIQTMIVLPSSDSISFAGEKKKMSDFVSYSFTGFEEGVEGDDSGRADDSASADSTVLSVPERISTPVESGTSVPSGASPSGGGSHLNLTTSREFNTHFLASSPKSAFMPKPNFMLVAPCRMFPCCLPLPSLPCQT